MARRRKVYKKRSTIDEVKPPIRFRRYKEYFLIVCEDTKTEPAYFNKFKEGFPDKTLYLECIGTGRDPLGVVEEARKERSLLQEKAKKEIDHTWVVFDKDDADFSETRIARFEEAYRMATENHIHIALSNEVFEVWFLIHFLDLEDHDALPRDTVYELLNKSILNHLDDINEDHDFMYMHGDPRITDYIFDYGNEELAMDRAKALRSRFVGVKKIDANPSTDVDLLVEELRSWIKFYNYDPKKAD